jgi:hypothetical protein
MTVTSTYPPQRSGASRTTTRVGAASVPPSPGHCGPRCRRRRRVESAGRVVSPVRAGASVGGLLGPRGACVLKWTGPRLRPRRQRATQGQVVRPGITGSRREIVPRLGPFATQRRTDSPTPSARWESSPGGTDDLRSSEEHASLAFFTFTSQDLPGPRPPGPAPWGSRRGWPARGSPAGTGRLARAARRPPSPGEHRRSPSPRSLAPHLSAGQAEGEVDDPFHLHGTEMLVPSAEPFAA